MDFFSHIDTGNMVVSTLLNAAVMTMPALTAAGTPSQEFGEYLRGYALLHGSPNLAEKIEMITSEASWSMLEVPLVAILTLDEDERISDAEIEAAFGCDGNCSFNVMSQGLDDIILDYCS